MTSPLWWSQSELGILLPEAIESHLITTIFNVLSVHVQNFSHKLLSVLEVNIITSILQIRSQDSELLLKMVEQEFGSGSIKTQSLDFPFFLKKSYYNPVVESQVTCRCLVKAVCSVFCMPFADFCLEFLLSTNVFAGEAAQCTKHISHYWIPWWY